VQLQEGGRGCLPYRQKETGMVRWFSVIILAVCLALGSATPFAWAQSGQDKVMAANEKAAQDYYKYGLILSHSLLGSVLTQTGDLKGAEQELRKAVQIKPDYAEGWNYLGEFLQAHGKQKEAQEAFARAKQYFRK
jgi:predicted Zn-dependent protease